jgi:hypothetical protein
VTGKPVVAFCYPGCESNGKVRGLLSSYGYKLAFSCGRSIDHRLSQRLSLSRIHIYDDMEYFKSILSGKWYYPY